MRLNCRLNISVQTFHVFLQVSPEVEGPKHEKSNANYFL